MGSTPTAARPGVQALGLLASPANAAIFQELAERRGTLLSLRRAAGSLPQTTNVEYELDEPGRDLLAVADLLATWLSLSPEGPIPLGSGPARSVVKVLVEGWTTNMVAALAAQPLSLTELDSVVSVISYPSLERRLGAVRLEGPLDARRAAIAEGAAAGLRVKRDRELSQALISSLGDAFGTVVRA